MTDSEKLAKLLEALEPIVGRARMYDHVGYERDVRIPLHELRALRDAVDEVKGSGSGPSSLRP